MRSCRPRRDSARAAPSGQRVRHRRSRSDSRSSGAAPAVPAPPMRQRHRRHRTRARRSAARVDPWSNSGRRDPMGYRLGIDVGGTFTDLVLFCEETGAVTVEKVPSVPSDPAQGIMDGIARILTAAGAEPTTITYVAHGTTVATNTLLQRNGARTALITTRGFRDLLEIARQRRPSLYDLDAPKPRALVRRKWRREVPERVTADGAVRVPLDLEAVDRALDELGAEGIEALAVCFLYSFLRPEHERLVVEHARQRLPAAAICASSDISPELREYERLSTTVA